MLSGLALASVVIGALVIVTRGPLVFAPEATLTFYSKLFSSNLRVRLLGLFLGGVAAWLVAMVGRGSDETAAVSVWAGGILAVVAAVLLIFSGPTRRVFITVLDFIRGMDASVPRGLGVIAVFIGALFVYIGIWVL